MSAAVYIEYPRITYIEVVGGARKPRLKRVLVGEVAEARNEDGTPITDRQDHLNKQVERFVKENKLKPGKIYLLVGPDGMRYRDMHLDFTDKRQIDRVLQFQVEGVLPNVSIDDLTVGYSVVRYEGQGTHLLIHAADKDYVRTRITALEENGFLVEAADSHLSGTLNLGLMHPEFNPDIENTLWLDFAGTTATVAMINKGEVTSARVFLAPYLAGSENAKQEAQAKVEEAERRAAEFMGEEVSAPETFPKAESVNIGEEEVADRIRSMSHEELRKFLYRVGVEARRTLLMANLDSQPSRLVVSGLGETGDIVVEKLGAELEIEDARAVDLMEVANPVDADGKPLLEAPDVGELSYLTGVALKGIGRDLTRINFRYGDLSPGTLYDYARTPLAFAATLALLFTGIMFLMAFTEARNFERDIHVLRDQAAGPRHFFEQAYLDAPAQPEDESEARRRRYPVIPDDPALEIREAHRLLFQQREWLQGATSEKYPFPVPASRVAALVMQAIQSARPSNDFALISLHVTERTLTVEFAASLTEDEEERRKRGFPPELVDVSEAFRMHSAINELVKKNPMFFNGEPRLETVGGGAGIAIGTGENSASVQHRRITVPLAAAGPIFHSIRDE